MEKTSKWKPEWLENEPKAPVSAYSYFQRNGFRHIRLIFLYSKDKIGNRESKMKVDEADQFVEMSLIEITKALAKMWRELPQENKNTATESFEKVT